MPEKQNLPGHSVLKERPALTEDHENIAVNILKGKKKKKKNLQWIVKEKQFQDGVPGAEQFFSSVSFSGTEAISRLPQISWSGCPSTIIPWPETVLKQLWLSHINIILITTTFYLNPLLIKTLKVHYIHISKMQQNPTWLLLHKVWAMTENTHVLNYAQFPERRLLFFNPLKVFIHV